MRKFWQAILVLVLCVSFPSAAAEGELPLSAGEDFAVFSQDPEETAARLGLSVAKIEEYCRENEIVYLAVDTGNRRQIRLSVSSTSFSESVGQLSNLSNEKILALIPEWTDGQRGEVIERDGQKFICQQSLQTDSGGDYVLTRYITIAAKKAYILTFDTAVGWETDYVETVFSTFVSPDFRQAEPGKEPSPLRWLLPILITLFSAASIFIIYTLIRDIRDDRHKQTRENETL